MGGSLRRDASRFGTFARGEGVVTVVKHLLGEFGSGDLDAEIAEHGVGLPATDELDVVGVNSGAHEGGSASWAERAGTEELKRDAGGGFEELRGELKGVGDVLRLDGVPAAVVLVAIEVREDGGIGGSPVRLETQRDAAQSLGGTVERVGVGRVADLLASDGILLVREAQCRICYALH